MTNKVWQYNSICDSSVASLYTGNTWFKLPNYKLMVTAAAGSTLVRTRLNGFFRLGLRALAGGTGTAFQNWCEQLRIDVGVYANPTVPTTTNPPAIPNNSSDGFWVIQTVPTLMSVSEYLDKQGNQNQSAVYKIPDFSENSQAQRGPGAAAWGIWLVWNFFSTNTWYSLDSTNYESFGGGTVKVACLLDTAPP